MRLACAEPLRSVWSRIRTRGVVHVDAVVAVRRLGIWPVEVVRWPRNVAVGRALVRLTRPPPAQGFVGLVEPAPHRGEALVSGLVESPLGLCPPEPVFLGYQFLDLIQDRLFVHAPSITRVRS